LVSLPNEDLISQIDIENLYQHIVSIEGVRHPLDNPEFLDNTAEYIIEQFDEYGLEIKEHLFHLPGLKEPFRNIEASFGTKGKELLITAHYDTVSFSPGANDNGSGIAGMLEIARVAAENDFNGNLRFIAFTLEEEHPINEINIRNALWDSGLVDDDYQFLTYHTLQVLEEFDQLREKAVQAGSSLRDSWLFARKRTKEKLTKKELRYLDSLIDLYYYVTRENWIGRSICVGSSLWVSDRCKKEEILGAINLEEIGYVTNRKHSQRYPLGINPQECDSYKVNIDDLIGNFVGILADKNSTHLAQNFFNACQNKEIKIPCHNLQVNMDFSEMAEKAIDLLRSDHAPFWREQIPAISVTDTFEFRYPFYHTSADTIEKLDFQFMKQVCQATILTIEQLTGK
jgi:hypothetical protein